MPRLIVGDRLGQLGNQQILFAHLIAFAQEFEWEVEFPAFYEHRSAFWGPSHGNTTRFPIAHNALPKRKEISCKVRFTIMNLVSRALRRVAPVTGRAIPSIACGGHTPDYDIDLSEMRYRSKIDRSFATLLFGWRFRNHELLAKHADTIRFYLAFHARPEVDAYLQDARSDGARICGVHIRRGDYADYKGGKYYFSLERYAELMRQAVREIGEGNVKFIIFSDEVIDLDKFGELNVMPAPGSVIDDQYALSRVDFIIGPPSTFSKWAAYIGQIPFFLIEN